MPGFSYKWITVTLPSCELCGQHAGNMLALEEHRTGMVTKHVCFGCVEELSRMYHQRMNNEKTGMEAKYTGSEQLGAHA